MMLKPLSIFAGFFVGAAVAIYIVSTQFSEPPSAEPVTDAVIPSAHDCSADALNHPSAPCKDKPATLAVPLASTTGDRYKSATPMQVRLVTQLEDMSSKGNSQARYELALQLQRQERGADAKMPTADEVASNRNLQRSVALLSEAIAAGNEDAQKLRDSMGDQARLLHTGR